MPLVPSSHATADDVERYTFGECHVFALALSRLTGWPIKLILDHGEPYWTSEDGEDAIPAVVHAYCLDPDHEAWDIKGVRPMDEVMNELSASFHILEYGSDEIHSEEELRHYCGCWSHEGEEIDRPLVEIMESDLEEARTDALRVLGDLIEQRHPGLLDITKEAAPALA